MAFEELKEKQSVSWSSAPYEKVSEQHLTVLDDLLDELKVSSGERLLDVACGTGELAVPAALRGAKVTGVDFASGLIDKASARAAQAGVEVRFEVGDAERLPYGDASFDVVTSTFGAMFAPDHAAVARELARVTAPSGRLGFTAWTPDGGVGQMFAVMKPYMAPPPPGTGSPFEWGRPDHVEDHLAPAFHLDMTEHVVEQRAPSGADMWALMSTSYGPTKTLAASLDGERRQQLATEFAAFFERYREGDEVILPRAYLRVIGRRRD